MNDIDGLMVSYMINITKPDERIYQALCDKYSLDKSKCLFFDDRKENVLAARKFGMDSTLVTDRNFLLNELKNYKIKRHFPEGKCRFFIYKIKMIIYNWEIISLIICAALLTSALPFEFFIT